MRHPMTQEDTELALATFVEEVECVANGSTTQLGRLEVLDALEWVTAELFDAHPLTNVFLAISQGA